ncbi:MAG: TRAP transporter small permease subunit, partial [Burkholderiales bacterium]|nr:TRAP transporter small permease subunit [Burkholderiales bacterium]
MGLLRKTAHALGGLMFLGLFGVFLVQITARFGFNRPLPWTDELAVVLYLWVILWACAFMVRDREHVVFDLLWNSASTPVRRAMKLLGHVLIGGLSLAALPASWDYVHFMAREGSP